MKRPFVFGAFSVVASSKFFGPLGIIPRPPRALATALCLALLSAIGFQAGCRDKHSDQSASDTPEGVQRREQEVEIKTRSLAERQKRADLETAEQQLVEKIAIARAQLQTFADEAESVIRLAREFDSEVTLWEKGVTALLQDERGRKLASNEASIDVFMRIYDQRRPAPENSKALVDRVQRLLGPVREAMLLDAPTYTPSEEARRLLDEERQLATSMVDAYRKPRQEVEALMSTTSGTLPTTTTLEEAMKGLTGRRAQERAVSVRVEEEAGLRLANKAKLQVLADDGKSIQKLVEELESERHQLEEELANLLINDKGKLIAANEAHIDAFQSISQHRRPTCDDIAATRERIGRLLAPMIEALAQDGPALSPTEEMANLLVGERERVVAMIDVFRRSRRELEALTSAAVPSKPATNTLADSINALMQRRAAERAEAIHAAVEEATKNDTAMLADDATVTNKQEAKNQVIVNAADREKKAAQAEKKASDTHEEAERTRKVALASSAKIRNSLLPFTTPGYWQPGDKRGEESREKKPVSYSKLVAYGVLRPGEEGLDRLLKCGNAQWWGKGTDVIPHPDRVRPHWGLNIKYNILNQTELEQLKDIQEYLSDLGPIMVELGMLAP